MITEWKEYNGSHDLIADLVNAAESNGVLIIAHDGEEYWFVAGTPKREILQHLDSRSAYPPLRYLICDPHPLVDMICQQARTGQPVWVRKLFECGIEKEWQMFVTNTPDWNIPNAEYSFTEFKGEV